MASGLSCNRPVIFDAGPQRCKHDCRMSDPARPSLSTLGGGPHEQASSEAGPVDLNPMSRVSPAGLPRRFPGSLAALGGGLMAIGAFLPFVTWPCWQCLVIGGQPPISVASLAQGYENWLVLLTLLTFATAAAGYLLGMFRMVAAGACLVTAVGAFALAVFEATQPGRLLRWAVLPADQAQASFWVNPPSTGLGIGFYAFLGGAIMAIIGAVAMLIDIRHQSAQRAQAQRLRTTRDVLMAPLSRPE